APSAPAVAGVLDQLLKAELVNLLGHESNVPALVDVRILGTVLPLTGAQSEHRLGPGVPVRDVALIATRGGGASEGSIGGDDHVGRAARGPVIDGIAGELVARAVPPEPEVGAFAPADLEGLRA